MYSNESLVFNIAINSDETDVIIEPLNDMTIRSLPGTAVPILRGTPLGTTNGKKINNYIEIKKLLKII